MPPVIYYRRSLIEQEELDAASKYFPCSPWLEDIGKGDIVLARYSVYPFYQDIEGEIEKRGARLLNSFQQHLYVADLQNWYEDLRDFTPETWFNLSDIPADGPFILKGRTNSRKDRWNGLMYAETKRGAIDIGLRLLDDPLISQQGIVVRRFIPLEGYGPAIGGCPVSKEYRFFCLNGKHMAGGFYWSQHSDTLREEGHYPDIDKEGPDLGYVYQILEVIEDRIPFVVLDIARTQDGNWILVELNDGQMSGLSDVNPDILYKNIYNELIR